MKELVFEYQPNNTEALDAQLKAEFGERYLSMDSIDGGLIFRFVDDQAGDKAALAAVLEAHNPDVKTERQERASDKVNARRRLLSLEFDTLREKIGKDPDGLLLDVLNVIEDFQTLLYED